MATATNTTLASARLPAPPAEISLNPIRDYRDAIWAHREPLPSHELLNVPVRRFVAAACAAEVRHARNDFLRVIYGIKVSPYFYGEVDPDVPYRYAHEARAGEALVWLSHLQVHDSDRRGPWCRWGYMSAEGKRHWLQERRRLLHGLIRAAAAYRAARASIDGGR